MAGTLKALTQIDLSGGENLVTSPYLLGARQSQRTVNLILDEHGSLRMRDGTLVNGSASSNSTSPIVKVFDFNAVNGTNYPLAIVYVSGSVNTLYNRSTSPWTIIGVFTTAYAIPDMVTFTNRALIAAGYETPRYYDGTTFAALSGSPPPGARHLASHLGYLWVWNTNGSTTADRKSVV